MGLGAREERPDLTGLVILNRNVPRYRGQDIIVCLQRGITCHSCMVQAIRIRVAPRTRMYHASRPYNGKSGVFYCLFVSSQYIDGGIAMVESRFIVDQSNVGAVGTGVGRRGEGELASVLRNASGSSLPSTIFASVTVGSIPPRP